MAEPAVAARVGRISPSPSIAAAGRVRELRAEGRRVLDLTLGEPDFDTPRNVKDAAVAAIAEGRTKYTAVNGTPELRRAILRRTEARTGERYVDGEVVVGAGAKQVIFLAFMATLDEGLPGTRAAAGDVAVRNEVIIPAPYWVSYPDMVTANGGVPVVVETGEAEGFRLMPSALRASLSERSAWLVLNSPGNPTGTVYTAAELRALAEVLADFPHVAVLADEIYDEIHYPEGPAASLIAVAPELRDRLLLVNGVSKSHAMTGWRIGYGLGPAPLVAAMNTLQSHMSSCPSSISQAAAAAALDGPRDFIDEALATYRERRDAVVAGIASIPGLRCLVPDGAFYAYVNCEGLIGLRAPADASGGDVLRTDQDVVLYLLERAGVAVVQGSAFGLSPYFRVSFATDRRTIDAAIEAMRRALAELGDGEPGGAP